MRNSITTPEPHLVLRDSAKVWAGLARNPRETDLRHSAHSFSSNLPPIKETCSCSSLDNGSCCIFDFSNHQQSSNYCSFDDESSFSSSEFTSVVSDTNFQLDFEDFESTSTSFERESTVSEGSYNSESSDSTLFGPALLSNRWGSSHGTNEEIHDGKLEGYDYWYNNNSYNSVQSETFENGIGEVFDLQRSAQTMQSVKFLENPRLEFLILQKLLRNSKDEESALSLLIHLHERDLLDRTVVQDCIQNALHEKPASPRDEAFRFLVDLHPQVLKERPLFQTFLLHCYSSDENPDDYWTRFVTLFEIGLAHYPEEIGFLFHKDYRCSPSILPNSRSPFESACVIFGGERVVDAVGDIIAAYMNESLNPNVLSTLGNAVTTSEDITMDALYFLVRREPTSALCSLHLPSRKSDRRP